MGDRVSVATGNPAGRSVPAHRRTAAAVHLVSHGRCPAHSAHQPCGLGALDEQHAKYLEPKLFPPPTSHPLASAAL